MVDLEQDPTADPDPTKPAPVVPAPVEKKPADEPSKAPSVGSSDKTAKR